MRGTGEEKKLTANRFQNSTHHHQCTVPSNEPNHFNKSFTARGELEPAPALIGDSFLTRSNSNAVQNFTNFSDDNSTSLHQHNKSSTDRFHSSNSSSSSLHKGEIHHPKPRRRQCKQQRKYPQTVNIKILLPGYLLMFAMGILGMKILYYCGGNTLHKLKRMSPLGTMALALIWS